MADRFLLGGKVVSGFSRNADDINFDKTGTTLQSDNVQDAISEINCYLSL